MQACSQAEDYSAWFVKTYSSALLVWAMTLLAMIAAFDLNQTVQEHYDQTSQALFATSAVLIICGTLNQKPVMVRRVFWFFAIHQACAWMHMACVGTAPKVHEKIDFATIYMCNIPRCLVCDIHPLPLFLLVFLANLLFSVAFYISVLRMSLPVAIVWSTCVHVSCVLAFLWLRRRTHAQYRQYCEKQALLASALAAGSVVPEGGTGSNGNSKKADAKVEGAAVKSEEDAQAKQQQGMVSKLQDESSATRNCSHSKQQGHAAVCSNGSSGNPTKHLSPAALVGAAAPCVASTRTWVEQRLLLPSCRVLRAAYARTARTTRAARTADCAPHAPLPTTPSTQLTHAAHCPSTPSHTSAGPCRPQTEPLTHHTHAEEQPQASLPPLPPALNSQDAAECRATQPAHPTITTPVNSDAPSTRALTPVGHSSGENTHRPATADECLVAGAGIAARGLAEHASSSQANDSCVVRSVEDSAVEQRMRPYRSRCARSRVNITLCGPAPDTLPPGALDDLLHRLSSSCGARNGHIMSDVAVRAGCVVLSVSLLGQLDAVTTAQQIVDATNDWAQEQRVALEGGMPITVQLNDGRHMVCLPHQAFLLGLGFSLRTHTPSILLPCMGPEACSGSSHDQPQQQSLPQPQPQPQPQQQTQAGQSEQPGHDGQQCTQAAGVSVELCVRVCAPEGVGAGTVLGWLGPADSPEEEEEQEKKEGEQEQGGGHEGVGTGCAQGQCQEQGQCGNVQQQGLQLRLLANACGGFLPLCVLGVQRCGCDNILDVQVRVTLPPHLPLPPTLGAPLTFQLFHRSALLCSQSTLLLPPSLAAVHQELQQLAHIPTTETAEATEQAVEAAGGMPTTEVPGPATRVTGAAAPAAAATHAAAAAAVPAAAESHPLPQPLPDGKADFVADLADWMQFSAANGGGDAFAATAATANTGGSGVGKGQEGAGTAGTAAVDADALAMLAEVGADLLCYAVKAGLVNLADLLLSRLLYPPFVLPFPALAPGSYQVPPTDTLAPTPPPPTPPTAAAPTQRPLGWAALASGSAAMLSQLLHWGHTFGGPSFAWCWKQDAGIHTSAPFSEDESAEDPISSTLAAEELLCVDSVDSSMQHDATVATLRDLCARCGLCCEPGCRLPRVLAVLACAAGTHAGTLLHVLQQDAIEGPRLARTVAAAQHAQHTQHAQQQQGVEVTQTHAAAYVALPELREVHTGSAKPSHAECVPLSAETAASSSEQQSAAYASLVVAAGTSTGPSTDAPEASGSSGLRHRHAAGVSANENEAACETDRGSAARSTQEQKRKRSTLGTFISSSRWAAWREAARCSLWGFRASPTAARLGGASEAGFRAWCTAFTRTFVVANLVLLSVGTLVGATRSYTHGCVLDGALVGLIPGMLFGYGLLSVGRPNSGGRQKASIRAGKLGHFLLWTLMGLKVIPINYASRLLLATYTEAAVALFASPVIIEQARPQSMLPERLYTSLMYGILYASAGFSHPLVRTLAVNSMLWAIEWLLHVYIMRTYLAHLATPIPRRGDLLKQEKKQVAECE